MKFTDILQFKVTQQNCWMSRNCTCSIKHVLHFWNRLKGGKISVKGDPIRWGGGAGVMLLGLAAQIWIFLNEHCLS